MKTAFHYNNVGKMQSAFVLGIGKYLGITGLDYYGGDDRFA